MTELTSILGSASAIAGLSAALGAIGFGAFSRQTVRTQTKLLTKISEYQALESTDIDVLGSYLYENVGTARISSYVHDSELRARVTRALEAVTEFLGAEPTAKPEAEAPTRERDPTATRERDPAVEIPESLPADVKDELRKALADIRFGEVWNGLARIRRLIEQQLRELSPDMQSSRPISVGRMLGGLSSEGIIPPDAEQLLSYAIRVSNAGIHGQEVEGSLALEAWYCAVQGLAQFASDRETPG